MVRLAEVRLRILEAMMQAMPKLARQQPEAFRKRCGDMAEWVMFGDEEPAGEKAQGAKRRDVEEEAE